MERYKIVDFYTEEETGYIVNDIETAKTIIKELEKENNTRYIPLTEEEIFDNDEDQIY